MRKLAIDIKDGYAALAAGGDFEAEYIKIDFGETDFPGEDDSARPGPTINLFDIGQKHVLELCRNADRITLAAPMRFSLVKPVKVDMAAIELYDQEFLRWEARQQLPDEIGEFVAGFNKLRVDQKRGQIKYLFYAVPRDFIEVLLGFVTFDQNRRPVLESEATGLYNILNLATDGTGVNAAVSLEHDGASVVIVRDQDFLAGRFIGGGRAILADEIMYYIHGFASEESEPGLLICGDSAYLDQLGKVSWARILDLPGSMAKSAGEVTDRRAFAAVAGLNLI